MQAMPPRTDFAQMRCPVARTMAVLGERWAILILREAYYGASHFDQFERNLGIAPNILSARLRALVAHGVLEKTAAARPAYRLTEKGRDFFPAFLALKRWGDRWMTDERGPLILLQERATGRPVEAPPLLAADGAALTPEMVRVLPGPGAGRTLRQRFSQMDPNDDD
jgi:DNA-binding HxlR family transcriptional regulator